MLLHTASFEWHIQVRCLEENLFWQRGVKILNRNVSGLPKEICPAIFDSYWLTITIHVIYSLFVFHLLSAKQVRFLWYPDIVN
ncbi:transmembrane protein, putative [Medicago truncatula]|uniref:Transmembrane protein, putative n=1 Tax=Medicago truncatula TaxID=3880 RepID=G7L775_MEDTR|nr:transmembrane protein, putative [Medicago truncatula]